MTAPRSRLPEIDVWRGMAITFVVVGHAIQVTTAGFDEVAAFGAIYSFHMPLFFFISGVANSRSLGRPLVSQLGTRARTLLLPFFSWFLVGRALDRLLHGTAGNVAGALFSLVTRPDSGLWFLWVLFIVSMLTALLLRTTRRARLLAFLLAEVALFAAARFLPGLGFVPYYAPFFAAGVFIARADPGLAWLQYKWPAWLHALVYALFAILLSAWSRTGPTGASLPWTAAGLPGATFIDLGYRYLTAAAGIAASLGVLTILQRRRVTRRLLSYLGRRTLEIYVSHQFLLAPFTLAGIIWVPVAAVMSIVGALGVAALLGRIRLLDLLLYGQRGRRPRALEEALSA